MSQQNIFGYLRLDDTLFANALTLEGKLQVWMLMSLWQFIRSVRSWLLLVLSLLILVATVARLLHAQVDPFATEHRISTVETQLSDISQQLEQLRNEEQARNNSMWDLLEKLALAGLVGEAGMRLRRKQEPE